MQLTGGREMFADKFEKFGKGFQLAKGMFKEVLEVTSTRMGEIITK